MSETAEGKITYNDAVKAHQNWINLMNGDDPRTGLIDHLDAKNHFVIPRAVAQCIWCNCIKHGKADIHVYFGVQDNVFFAFILDTNLDAFSNQFNTEGNKKYHRFDMQEGKTIGLDQVLFNDAFTRAGRWQQSYKDWLGLSEPEDENRSDAEDSNKFYCISFPFSSFDKVVRAPGNTDLRFYLGLKPTPEVADYSDFEVELLLTNAPLDSDNANYKRINTFSDNSFQINNSTTQFAVANISTPIPPYPPQFQLNEMAFGENQGN